MAAQRVGRRVSKVCGSHRSPGQSLQRRQARVTVKYNRKELQRRLDVEKWIDCGLDQLYRGREDEMPEEVNIDDLLDLKTDEERTRRLQETFLSCNNNTEVFIRDLLVKLHGLQKQEDLHNDGIDLPQLHIYPSRSGSADRDVLHRDTKLC
ncbi:protein phosphatase 1, regulatory (inhibitor) subunit 14Ab [Acanthopagrus latus]|uniref:protein phosphatase 1, regulatory (inhibitor) subunit 14Ab n=1 Tax=Acanthopagrus latus TaxID=8177 RepID=UPI00187BD9B4|nr:protein phosphatase 1, regulatory (inhibitor) subunit 14Ab [Acanthopagrus latus]